MKQTCLLEESQRMRAVTSIRSMLSPARLYTLHCMQANTQGKRQWKMQQHARGKNLELDSLHNYARLEQAESTTIKSHCSLISKETPPMLRPHPTTRYPSDFKYFATVSTSFAYYCPSVMKSPSLRLPHPLKSKQANPTLSGRQLRKRVPSKHEDPLPWRQSSTQSIVFCLYKVTSNGTISVSTENLWAMRLEGCRMSGLQTKRGGRMSMKANCSRRPSCGQWRISQVCGRASLETLSSWTLFWVVVRFIASSYINSFYLSAFNQTRKTSACIINPNSPFQISLDRYMQTKAQRRNQSALYYLVWLVFLIQQDSILIIKPFFLSQRQSAYGNENRII